MSANEEDRIVTELLDIAARAGEAIARVYATNFDVDYKSPNDPVTLADRQANEIICQAIDRMLPGVPIVAEESDPASYGSWRDALSVFFVDPLDGTRDFVKRNGEFVVMIGLAESGRSKLGVIHAPATGRSFAGGDNVPSFEAIRSGGHVDKKPLRVSELTDLSQAELVVSRSRPSAKLMEIARGLGIAKVTELGSAGLKALRVASGEADIYAHGGTAGSRWDSCAPEAITRAAGGVTTDLEGSPIDYRAASLENTGGILVTNGKIHARMLEAVRELAAAKHA